MANRLLLAAYFVWRFFTKQWWDIFYWSRARVLHSLMRLRDPRKLTDHQLLSLLSWHAHQTEKATKHRSANRPGEKARGHRHFAALEHYLAELATRRGLTDAERGAIAWIRDVRDEYAHWRDTPGHINITDVAASEPPLPATSHPADIADLIHRRTSARVWLPREIPGEIIEQLIDAGLQAPSSCNRQGVVINVVENSFPRESKEGVNNAFMLHNAPAIFYITADPSLYPERQAPALDAGMAAQNILLLAESLGLAGCAMYHSESFNQKALQRRLGLPKNLYTYVALLIGYPGERAKKPVRMSHAIRSRRSRSS